MPNIIYNLRNRVEEEIMAKGYDEYEIEAATDYVMNRFNTIGSIKNQVEAYLDDYEADESVLDSPV